MRDRITIIFLFSILIILLFHLYGKNGKEELSNKTQIIDVYTSIWNPNTAEQWIIKLENDMAREDVLKTEDSKNYMLMYPDLYAEKINPIIFGDSKIAFLTFDDGPSKRTTNILRILEEKEVKATFFVLGSTITEEGRECLKVMAEKGHVIGIHTFSHDYKDIYSSVEAYLEDFYKVYQLIYETTGVKVSIFRFPWGSVNGYNKKIKVELIDEMKRRGFTCYDWNVSADDSIGNPTKYGIKNNILKDLEKVNNPIILMHDASINKLTVEALPDIIESIKKKGYEFYTLEKREQFVFGQ